MNNFLRPSGAPSLPQGDYRFTPRVKLFYQEDVHKSSDLEDLEEGVNDWLDTFLVQDGKTVDVVQMEYSLAGSKEKESHASILVFYTLIERI